MQPDHLLTILDAWKQAELDGIARESAQSAGSTYLRERLQVVAERCCRDYEGSLVEIGCLNGSTTVRLAQVAKVHGRRVIAIDPYAEGTQNCTGAELPRFLQAIEPYKDIVDFLRLDSRDPQAIEYLKARPLCFSFVDGLHEYQACISDIYACYHSPLVVIDDYTWNSDIKRAWYEATGTRTRIEFPPLHEGYLL